MAMESSFNFFYLFFFLFAGIDAFENILSHCEHDDNKHSRIQVHSKQVQQHRIKRQQ